MNVQAILVPLGPNATGQASADVARWSKLFPPDAYEQRAAILDPFFVAASVDLTDRRLTAVRSSLGWGTTTEVALRLMDPDAPPEIIARADAVAALLRVTFGLIARRTREPDPIMSVFQDVVAQALTADARFSPVATTWNLMSDAMSAKKAELPWDQARIEAVATSQPLCLAVRCLQSLDPNLDSGFAVLARSYSATAWLAGDLLTLVNEGRAPIGPAADLSYHVLDRATIASSIRGELSSLNDHAFELRRSLDELAGDLGPDMRTYGETTIRFAAEAYSRLNAAGYLA